ncbi:hypothetical protein [Clostridium cellulovorans]|uniref:Uncharacterized protein n=1 Tax=Clostridium cellulovorans (strain ATCC 35296 / DSM 3052 / OCM 3 / 743B) TaxID=573061 RepID=D9SSJ8_CLOC7|nr:hypothetical protein [Clostridium cellulovorans]ADL50595.1 hypothetical protein Clocel_0825 [Clostridium cellulovorans 743B]
MTIGYQKLFVGVSFSKLAKLRKNKNVNTDILVKKCTALKGVYPILWELKWCQKKNGGK